MSADREELARYQAALLDALHQFDGEDESELLVQRLAEQHNQPVGKLDTRMTHLAAELTKKWGVRR